MAVRTRRSDLHQRGAAGVRIAAEVVVAGFALVTMFGLSACGSSGSGGPAPSSTSSSTSIETTTVPVDLAATCAILADTVGLEGLVPIDSTSWRDERERILVDSQREAVLLRRAATGGPAELSEPLGALADHADRVAEEISQAGSYTDAMDRLESTGVPADLEDAAVTIDLWRSAHC